MKHLTEEQISALLDEALPAGERAACEAHLAGCDACRARLADASALEASLGRARSHDPGEAYFADFAERVAKRIATQPAPAPERRSAWAWFTSPRGLTFAGSTAALVLTAGIAWMRFHNNESEVTRAFRQASPAPAVEPRLALPAPSSDAARPAPEPSPPAASAPAPSAPTTDLSP